MAKNDHLYELGSNWALNLLVSNGSNNPKIIGYNFISSVDYGILIRTREHETSKHTIDEEVSISKRDYSSIVENFRKRKTKKNKLLIVRSYLDSVTKEYISDYCYFILIDEEVLKENSYFYFKQNGENGIKWWESTGRVKYYKWNSNQLNINSTQLEKTIKNQKSGNILKRHNTENEKIALLDSDSFDQAERKMRSINNKILYKIGRDKTLSEVFNFNRNPAISAWAKNVANGYCQLCNLYAPFNDVDGFPFLESHHIKWLSKGGADSIDNVVALCPNCHRKMHILNNKTDVQKLIARNLEHIGACKK